MERATDELLERDAELATLAEVADEARSRSGALLLVEGPAGIGKTRLIETALVRASDAGLAVASAKASELERDFPLGVARQLLEPRLASIPPGERKDVLAGPARVGASALGDIRSLDTSSSTEASYATLHGLYWLTANLAAIKPLLITVDDAHWADQPSLRFLAYLAKRIEGIPACVVLARRPVEPGAGTYLLDEIASDSAARLVKPASLSAPAVTEFVRARVSPAAHERFCSACHRATQGNPFLLNELVREFVEQGVAGTEEDAGRVGTVAPDSVGKSVLRRLGRMPEAAHAVARAVAVLGDEAEPRLVAKLAGVDVVSASEVAEILARMDIFRSRRTMAFSHPIVRAAIYSSLSASERARAHRRAAELLADEHGDLDRMAAHLLATEASADGWVVEVLREAARAALARGAPDVAATYLRRALPEAGSNEARADILVELGRAEVAGRPPPAGIEHVREALDLTNDSRRRALISLELGRALSGSLDFQGAAQVLERALLELDGQDPHLGERLEAQLMIASLATLATAPRAYQRMDDRLEAAEAGRLRDPALIAALAFLASIMKEPAAKGARLAQRALAGGRLIAERDTIALTLVTGALGFADRNDAAMRVWDEALVEARRSGSMPLFAFGSCFRSHNAWRVGLISAAEADARAVLSVSGVREAQAGLPFAVMVLVDVLIERGDVEGAARALAENGISGPLPEFAQLNFVLESRGRLRLAQGRAREALDDFLECGRRLDAWGFRNPGSIPWRSSAAMALNLVGERDEGLSLARAEIELARRFQVPRELGMALRAAGLVEGGDAGIDLLREAANVLEDSPAALERARALTDLGAALRRSGRRTDARQPLRRALELAQQCGAKALETRAQTELVAAGARPRRVALTGVHALTASERRVAEMAAEGLTNREIAQALFVTEKTVEWHLSQAYRKLDIRSRSELAAMVDGAKRSPDRT